jgi:hypothetical protein
VDREPRGTTESYIHYGLIASGNQVMKNAKTWDCGTLLPESWISSALRWRPLDS